MAYYIDLAKIDIDQFKEIIQATELIPSWKILQNNLDEDLDILKNQRIGNLDELLRALKNKDKIQAFAQQSGLDENYLVVLKRMVSGYRQKPTKIKDFPSVPDHTAHALEKLGIKTTLTLYDHILTQAKRNELAEKSGVEKSEIMKLTSLTDLSRIRWVNHTFAYVLLEAGFDSAKKVAQADFQQLYIDVKQLNEDRKIYKAHIGPRDMKMCIEAAKLLDFDIIY